MNELNCSVVADLLPLYVEDIVSPETRQAIAEHLETCEECRTKYEQMLTDVPVKAELNNCLLYTSRRRPDRTNASERG